MEKVAGDRAISRRVDKIREGDEVDVPVWLDIWFPPFGMKVKPIVFLSFDRVVIISRGN